MFKIHPEIPESMSLEAKAFILRCFEPNPDRRATALDLLTDEFLTVTSRKKKSKSGFTGRFGPSSAPQPRNFLVVKSFNNKKNIDWNQTAKAACGGRFRIQQFRRKSNCS